MPVLRRNMGFGIGRSVLRLGFGIGKKGFENRFWNREEWVLRIGEGGGRRRVLTSWVTLGEYLLFQQYKLML
jgi:hypothetical protein